MSRIQYPIGKGSGRKSGTIPVYHVYVDYGLGLHIWKHPAIGIRLSRAVASEMVSAIQRSPDVHRVIMTQVQG